MSAPGFVRSAPKLDRCLPWAEARVLLLTACDRGYLPHALALARSLDAFSPGAHLMLHLVNPDEPALALIEAERGLLAQTQLHLSTEKVALPPRVPKAAYYASARFLRMAELLDLRSSVPVLALDADTIAVAPLTFDFSDKPEAEICLRMRGEDVPGHLQVAAGAVWARSTPRSREFFQAVAGDLVEAFASGEARWFVDQVVLARHVAAGTAAAKVRNLKTRFADWDLGDDAVFWMGKGDRKYSDVRYLLLRDGFDADPALREAGRLLHARCLARLPSADAGAVMERAGRHFAASRPVQAAIFLPRLDLPWKPESLRPGKPPPDLAPDTLELRLWWKRFAMTLAASLTGRGVDVRIVEIPAWAITPERVDAEGVDMAFVPHRSHLDFGPTRTLRRFYMQQYLAQVFVLDRSGWGPASSRYPVRPETLPAAVLGAWDQYTSTMATGTLASKFAQRPRQSRSALLARGQIPDAPFLFFPLQLPHDRAIAQFSDVSMELAFDAVVAFGARRGLIVVAKEHPANRASMQPFRERANAFPVLWSEAHVHDLLCHAGGIVTVNSGVGFEALLADRPVVCLGRADYDRVVHSTGPDGLDTAWDNALAEDPSRRRARYARFVDWFLGRYAVDLSRPATSAAVLRREIDAVLAEAMGRRAGHTSDGLPAHHLEFAG
ncbi:capsular polysaccharide export protein, LipB/KpsS family [Lysobacter xanthus]